MYKIITAQNTNQIKIVKKLFILYQKELDYDLCFQNFNNELKTLPGAYKQPDGDLLLIKDMDTNNFAGCVALKKHNKDICEMKRLYVLPKFRNKGYGKILIKEILDRAKIKGYKSIILDTLKELKPALILYRKYGFKETKPYYNNPLEGVIYMIKKIK